MGATTFEVYGNGKTDEEAFHNAAIAGKDSFTLVTHTPVTEEEATEIVNRHFDTVAPSVDKWGPAAVLPLAEGGWLFFGWASS